jgi:hypothetical protein
MRRRPPYPKKAPAGFKQGSLMTPAFGTGHRTDLRRQHNVTTASCWRLWGNGTYILGSATFVTAILNTGVVFDCTSVPPVFTSTSPSS